MPGILDLLNSDLGKTIINGVSQETNEPESKTQSVLSMALPLLMGAMKKNASSPEGASGLLNAITGKHDGSILDNLSGLFGGGVDQEVQTDGEKILGHVLGNKQATVENALSQKAGIDAGSVSKILKIAAPIVMGMLGKETRNQNISSANGIGDMLGGLLGGSGDQNQSLLTSLLDADGDGSVVDDVAGMVLGGNKKKGGLGGLIGGLFGK